MYHNLLVAQYNDYSYVPLDMCEVGVVNPHSVV